MQDPDCVYAAGVQIAGEGCNCAVPAGPTGLKGPLGVAVVQSKLTWRDWSVEGASGDYALKHIQGPYQGDDRRYVDLIEQDILDRNLGVRRTTQPHFFPKPANIHAHPKHRTRAHSKGKYNVVSRHNLQGG